MLRSASQTDSNVSAGEAFDALEVLANVLYLTARNADDGERVRRLVDEADSCVSTLAQFMKTQNVTFAQNRTLCGVVERECSCSSGAEGSDDYPPLFGQIH